MLNKFKTYFKAILIPVLVGGIVGFFISGSIDYNSLEKPFLCRMEYTGQPCPFQ